MSPDKPRVSAEISCVLKDGGELYFSDISADRCLPARPAPLLDDPLLDDPVLIGECFAGTLCAEDFRRLLQRAGCPDAPPVRPSGGRVPVTVDDPDIEWKIGLAAFTSQTVRAFKLPLDDRCEDYGQVAVYHGTVPEYPHAFDLDDHHTGTGTGTGKPMPVCGNTAGMLSATRHAPHFTVAGGKFTYFGLFPCAPSSGPPRVNPARAGKGRCVVIHRATWNGQVIAESAGIFEFVRASRSGAECGCS
jgi:hypothetical protein